MKGDPNRRPKLNPDTGRLDLTVRDLVDLLERLHLPLTTRVVVQKGFVDVPDGTTVGPVAAAEIDPEALAFMGLRRGMPRLALCLNPIDVDFLNSAPEARRLDS
jgi:hypothetical protein